MYYIKNFCGGFASGKRFRSPTTAGKWWAHHCDSIPGYGYNLVPTDGRDRCTVTELREYDRAVDDERDRMWGREF